MINNTVREPVVSQNRANSGVFCSIDLLKKSDHLPHGLYKVLKYTPQKLYLNPNILLEPFTKIDPKMPNIPNDM